MMRKARNVYLKCFIPVSSEKMKTRKREAWEEYYSAMRQIPGWLKKPVPFIVEAVPVFKDHGVKSVLDLGCGVGRHCVYLAKMGFNVTGTDISRSALRTAKAWSRTETGNTAFVRAAMTDQPFVGNCFQAVVSVSVVHHSVKREIRRTV